MAVSMLLITLLSAKWVGMGMPVHELWPESWLLKSEGVFMILVSVSLFLAQRSWQAEYYHATRDRLFVASLAAASLLCVHVAALGTLYSTSLVAVSALPTLLMIEALFMLHLLVASGMLLWALVAHWRHISPVDGYILRLRPGITTRVQLLGLVWAGTALLWLYLRWVLA